MWKQKSPKYAVVWDFPVYIVIFPMEITLSIQKLKGNHGKNNIKFLCNCWPPWYIPKQRGGVSERAGQVSPVWDKNAVTHSIKYLLCLTLILSFWWSQIKQEKMTRAGEEFCGNTFYSEKCSLSTQKYFMVEEPLVSSMFSLNCSCSFYKSSPI